MLANGDHSRRILVAEDDPVGRRLLEGLLAKWGYTVLAARDGLEAWELLQRDDAPRLVILDWLMPGLDGLEVCRRLRQRTQAPYVYTLLLTAKDTKPDMVEGLEAGADDYLAKPLQALELRARLRSGERILALQEQLITTQNALLLRATRDALTCLWNRAEIFEILERELERARREGDTVSLILADLDHFKLINDTYGHVAGDAVLKETARRLAACVRPYDSVGRYGGEEFLIVAPHCDPTDASSLAQRLLSSLAQAPIDIGGRKVPLTTSLGVAVGGVPGYDTSDSLLQVADAALYRAKAAGRNCIELAPADWAQPAAPLRPAVPDPYTLGAP